MCTIFKWLNIVGAIGNWVLAIGCSFPKSSAKVLLQTAKTCQKLEKNAHFLKKSAFF